MSGINLEWWEFAKHHETVSNPSGSVKVEIFVHIPGYDGITVNPGDVSLPELSAVLLNAAGKYYDMLRVANAAVEMGQFTLPDTLQESKRLYSALTWLDSQAIKPVPESMRGDLLSAITRLTIYIERLEAEQRTNEQSKSGYVYLVRAVTPDNHFKIGMSIAPINRIEAMAVKLPFPLDVLHLIPTDDRFRGEKSLHDKYSRNRLNGEWFELSDDQVAEICSIESMMFGGVA